MGERAKFATKLGVIATTVGSAVGLGNIWRFPYEAGMNGGGAFLMIYILCVLILGVPVMCAEFIIGRKSKSDTVDAFKKLIPGSRWHYIGYIGILASILILGYYMVISGWTLEYLFQAACNNLTGKTAAEFKAEQNAFIQNDFRPLLWIYIFLFINYIIISKGVQKGIEKMSNILMPILFIILIVFCIRSLTLPEANEGLKFFLHPDFSKITPQVIVRAMGQAFFSLSLGMGILITYSSYFNNKTHLIKTAGTVSDTRHNRRHSGRSNYIPGCFLLWRGSCRRSRSCICHPPQCIQSNAGICVMVCIVFLTPHCGSSYFHRFSFRSCSCIFYQPHAFVKEKGNPDNDDHCCHIKHCLLSFYRFMEPYTHFWENHIQCPRLLLSYHLVASRRTVDKYFHRVDTETKYLPGGID